MTLEEYAEKKGWLKRIIQSKESRIRFFQDKAVNCTAGYSKTSGCTASRNVHPTEDAMVEIEALRDAIRSDKKEMKELDAAFLKELAEMENPTLAVVLELKDVRGGTWQDVSRSMQYSVRQVHRLHNEAAEYLRKKGAGGA